MRAAQLVDRLVVADEQQVVVCDECRDEVFAVGLVDAELVGEVDNPFGCGAVVNMLELLVLCIDCNSG